MLMFESKNDVVQYMKNKASKVKTHLCLVYTNGKVEDFYTSNSDEVKVRFSIDSAMGRTISQVAVFDY